MPPNHPKIFLSSTYTDLRDARAKVIRWLIGIFGASLIVMETSGSDAAPPNVASIRRVRQCDIFVGIYGHRYGTIDPASGESITELELDEAQSAQSAGVIRDILLYAIEPTSKWLAEFADTSLEAQTGRTRLKGKLKRHTYAVVRTETDLLFSIVRDVYRSVAQRFLTEPRALRSFNPPSTRPMRRPIGMEFLTSSDAEHLMGREDAVHESMLHLDSEKMVLLLGESGVGKTSLIHAGIIPRAAALGWRPVYTRPLSAPSTNIIEQIESSVFVDGIRRAPLLQTVAELLSALGDKHILLIIDQFDDALNNAPAEDIEELLSGLSALRELSEPKLHILISYRADLEARLGTLWQRISGSPKGLARVYIAGLNDTNFWNHVKTTCGELGFSVGLTNDEMARVFSDITVASKSLVPSGLYPPYVQMLIEYMFSSTRAGEAFTFQAYQKADGIFGIVRDYLSKQLSDAQDDAGELRLVLIALVKSYGVKAQRSLKELTAETGLDVARCDVLLERLIDRRLVRHISGQ
jgi:energy-coupling factor transporter ATP-binding protein EcfA2